MDFVTALREEYDQRVRPLVQQRDALRKQLIEMRSKIESESVAEGPALAEVGRLKNAIGGALAQGEEAYKQLEADLDNAVSEHQKVTNRIKMLEERLPHVEAEWATLARRVEEQRQVMSRERLALAQAEVQKGIESVLAVYDQWCLSWMELSAPDGDVFLPAGEAVPRLDHERLDRQYGRIIGLPLPEYQRLQRESQPEAD